MIASHLKYYMYYSVWDKLKRKWLAGKWDGKRSEVKRKKQLNNYLEWKIAVKNVIINLIS